MRQTQEKYKGSKIITYHYFQRVKELLQLSKGNNPMSKEITLLFGVFPNMSNEITFTV